MRGTMKLCGVAFLAGLLTLPASAQIYNWSTGQVIPGTEGITPRPGMGLQFWNTDSHNLRYADLSGGLDLHDSGFGNCWLDCARLTRANLTLAQFYFVTLTHADLSGANLTDAALGWVDFSYSNLSGANFTGAWNAGGGPLNVSHANLSGAILTVSGEGLPLRAVGTDLSNADLANGDFTSSTWTDADLTGATIVGASFAKSTGLTSAQFYSTSSYRAKDLRGVHLWGNNLVGWDFSGQDLSNAMLSSDFVVDESVDDPWNSNLTGATFAGANLTNARFFYARLTDADFSGAIVAGTQFEGNTLRGFTAQQLYATASFKAGDLHGIGLREDLTGWNLSGQNLTGANFSYARLTNVDLSLADTRATDLTVSQLATALTRNTILPDGHIAGLDLGAAETLKIWDYDGSTDWHGISHPAIALHIEKGMNMGNDGVLKMILEADAWDSTISFDPGIPVRLGGTLALTFARDVNIAGQIGRTFDLFDWTGVSPAGTFNVSSLYEWDLSNLYTTGEVTLITPEPATLLLLAAAFLAVPRRVTRSVRTA